MGVGEPGSAFHQAEETTRLEPRAVAGQQVPPELVDGHLQHQLRPPRRHGESRTCEDKEAAEETAPHAKNVPRTRARGKEPSVTIR